MRLSNRWIGIVLGLLAAGATPSCKKKTQESTPGNAPAAATTAAQPGTTTEPAAAQPAAAAAADAAAATAEPPAAQKPALEPVALKNAPTDEEKTAATALAAKLADDAQRDTEVHNADNARLFLVLASTGDSVPVVAAALQGLAAAWKDDAAAAFLDDYRAVVAGRLAATQNEILAPAVAAATAAIASTDPVDEGLAKALFGLMARPDDAAVPYAAIEVLHNGKKVLAVPGAKDAFLAAFGSSHPNVAADALVVFSWLSDGDFPEGDGDAYRAKIEELLQHADPAVRGEACGALTEFVPFGNQEAALPIAKLILPLLDDSNPFVRSNAAAALADLKFKPAIHAFVKHLDDKTANTYDTPGWTTLDGGSGWDHHDGSAWSRVDDAMLHAMMMVTYFDDVKFSYDVNTGSVDEDLAKAVTAARAWYEAHKADIPALPE